MFNVWYSNKCYYLKVILLVGTGTCMGSGYMHMTKHVSYYLYYLVPVLQLNLVPVGYN